MFAQDTSRIRSRRSPSRAAKPISAAAASTAMSRSGMNPTLMMRLSASPIALALGVADRGRTFCDRITSFLQERRRREQALGDVGDLALLVHGGLPEPDIGLLLADAMRPHQDALGPVDELACG